MAIAAVIDIGSNTIKVLVAKRDSEDASLQVLKTKTIEARISAGISHSHPELSSDAMIRGLAAIKDLLNEAASYSPNFIILVATSAVRDALNGPLFCDTVLKETGHSVRILTGEEEANGIGRGLLCDPHLKSENNFMVFDLGGGSLECLNFTERKIVQKISLPLGCVRLTERFVSDVTLAFKAADKIKAHIKETVEKSGFKFNTKGLAIGTGGTLTTARHIIAIQTGQTLETCSPTLTLHALKALHRTMSGLALKDRLNTLGLPKGRADVFPAALETLISLAELGDFESYHHSMYNLRWGLASEALTRA